VDGAKALTLRGPNIADEFKTIVEDYIENRYAKGKGPGERLSAR
jgi:(E)-4-hydroxy-3-methylbut-2-enyl-diphosphate synthase